jgi:RNA polymerase sigma factor (sigma-70 family)
MDEHDWLAQRFEAHRSHLRAVAYRLLGSLSEADDAVQEAWLRLSRADPSGVDNLGRWLTTVVARVCLDMLRSRAARREELLGVHLPDPIIRHQDALDPEEEALLAEGVGLALLVVMEQLAPAERLALVLHDTFAVPFEEIAAILGRSPAAARQLASRARRRVRASAALPNVDLDPAQLPQAEQAERMPAKIEPVAGECLKQGHGEKQRASDNPTRQQRSCPLGGRRRGSAGRPGNWCRGPAIHRLLLPNL